MEDYWAKINSKKIIFIKHKQMLICLLLMYLSTEKKDFEKMSDLQNSEKTIIYEEIALL